MRYIVEELRRFAKDDAGEFRRGFEIGVATITVASTITIVTITIVVAHHRCRHCQ